MKRKPVPVPPDTLDALEASRAALPLVPGSEDDCCRRLMARADVADRSSAGEWLEFLCALGLARETSAGFVRTREDLDRERLGENFRDGVVLAADALDAVAAVDRATSTDAVFERVRDAVPAWERRKRDDWEAFWRDQVERRLEWAILLGLLERTNGGVSA